MIIGAVSPDQDPIIEIRLLGGNGREEDVLAVVDTGLRGALCLPPDLVVRLAFPAGPPTEVRLAGDVLEQFATTEASLLWDGRVREVSALQAPGEVLVGMALLAGYHLGVDASPMAGSRSSAFDRPPPTRTPTRAQVPSGGAIRL